nr:MAG TPA: putative outer membrane protein [Caudoviricetes sp.]
MEIYMNKKKMLLMLSALFTLGAGAHSASAAEVTKNGQEITVNKPDVTAVAHGDKYSQVTVKYGVKFDDQLIINQGDKVKFTLPNELGLQTNYNFDVKSVEGNVVGNATADVATKDITTIFNDYFSSHPMNKTMNLELMTKWDTEKVSGKETKTYDLNFNGTIVPTTLKKTGTPDSNEIVNKWGGQDEKDPSIVHWGARLNYRKDNLTNVTITDTLDNNHEYVKGSLKARIISSIDPWTIVSEIAKENINETDHGFTITLPTLDQIVSVEYDTKVKDLSKDPKNNIRIQATNGLDWDKDVLVQIVRGSGNVSGDQIPPQPAKEEPSKEEPTKPSKEEPTKPSKEEPTKPSKEEPVKPSKEEPTKPSKEEPTKPSKEEPVKPSKEEPAKPSKEEPTKPSKEEPTKPSKEEPVKPSKEEPTKPSKEEPTKPSKVQSGNKVLPNTGTATDSTMLLGFGLLITALVVRKFKTN